MTELEIAKHCFVDLEARDRLSYCEWFTKQFAGWLEFAKMSEEERRLWGDPHFRSIVEELEKNGYGQGSN